MNKLFFILFSFFIVGASAQDCYVQNKKLVKQFQNIDKNLSNYSLQDVKDILMEIETKEGISSQINDMYALIYYLTNDNLRSIEFAIKTINSCPDKFATSNYILGIMSFDMKDYQISVDYLTKATKLGVKQRFKENATTTLEKASVLAQIMRDTVPYNPEIVKGVSTKYDEYLPFYSHDQEGLYFTRKGVRDEFGVVIKDSEDFMKSEGSLGNLTGGESMPLPFNQSNNEGGATITIDNKVLYFTICSKLSSNNCDIYYVERKQNGEWTDLKPMHSINEPSSWESQPSVSKDGNSLIFTSDRRGGYGGTDLYIVKKDEFGYWGVPQNMGDIINSKRNEKSPFLHVDDTTMYFASEQFPSLGGFDIFISKKNKSSVWQKPKNIGFPINTKYNEEGMFVTTDGKKAYFHSDRLEGVGGWDLYSFDLYDKAKPKRVLFLKGDITDSDGVMVDSVSLELKNITTNYVTHIFVNGGKYVSALTLEKSDDVLITFNKEGYTFNSHYISSTNEKFSSPLKMNVNIDKIESGKTFEINNIYFATNSFDINHVTKSILIEFANYLNKNKNLELLISGHTDNVGSEEDNMVLSRNRARSVYTFLVESGISENRLTYQGFGESKPVYDNSTSEGRSKNRRTECTIINK